MMAVRAELRRMLRWPALWVLCGVWLALNLTFAYVFPYLTYHSGTPVGPGRGTASLAMLLPDHAPVATVQGLPMFGGALVLILGALTVGSGYGWGTWKTVFTAGPQRAVALAGTFAALGVVLVGLVLATLALDLAAATTVAVAEHQHIVAPSAGATLRGLGAALLIGLMWTVVGVLVGALARGPALAVGLGLVWTLVVENLLRGVASLLGPLQTVTNALPGTAAGSLAAATGALPVGEANGTPGVNTILDGRTALAVVVAYLLACAAATVGLVSRRDLAG
jgi:ABC-type transport system involved in multi-copper enzyme maturation permease subunit